jgi:hypothetical protein
MYNNFTLTSNENQLICHITPLLYDYFVTNDVTSKNSGFLLDISIKLFYTDDVRPLNSKIFKPSISIQLLKK